MKSKLLDFSNLVKYAEQLRTELIDDSAQSAAPAWSKVPPSDGHPSSSTDKSGGFSNWSKILVIEVNFTYGVDPFDRSNAFLFLLFY